MELQCDLGAIQSEDILRRMWQQSEDINRKKEIRSHLYKLRESRLRDLYHGDIMSGNSAPGFGKDPLNPSHGDSLVDQSFQSLKSKETRDSISPTHDLKFHSMTLNHPNTTGWDVQSSSEVSPDGRAYRTETVAKTDGVEKINGGTTEFKGRNEQRASASHQGDDKNFVKKASESSNTNLQEKVVVGDEHSGRTEMKMSSATSSSSSQVVSSSSTVQYGDETADNRYLTDSSNRPQQVRHQHQQPNQQHYLTQEQYEQQLQRQNQQQQHHHEQSRQIIDNQTTTRQQQQQQQQQQQYTEEYNRNLQESSTSRNVETQQLHEQNKRYVDMDKASPEYQQHVQNLMAQPGEIISNTVEYPKPNVKMITTVKRLPDGTIVKNKRYETEELRPAETTRPRTTSSTSQTQNQSSTQHNTQRRERNEKNIYSRQQNTRDSNTTHSKNSPRRPDVDMVDNVYDNKQQLVATHPTERYVDDVTNVETKFSSVKKSSRRFSTETTSETIEEHSDYSPSGRHAPQDFSTHGFPSVKANKPTQEYPTDRPHAPHPTSDFTTQGFPSVKPNKPTQEYPSDRPRGVHSTDHQEITERYVTDSKKPSSDLAPHGFPAQIKPIMTKDGEVIVVSSEATKSSKFKTNAERIIETEVITSEGDYPSPTGQRPEKITYHTSKPQTRPEDFTTHGFPSVKGSSPARSGTPRQGTPSREHPSSPLRSQPSEDFSTHGFPSVRSPTKPAPVSPAHGFPTKHPGSTHEDVIIVSSETQKTSKQKANREHIIETEVITEDGEYSPRGGHHPQQITYTTSPRRPEDFSTHGFPSVKDSSPVRGGSPRHGTPIREHPSSPRKSQPSDDFSTHGFPSVKSPTKSSPDYSTHGFPSAKDTTRPKQYAPQPKPQPTTTTTKKSTTTTDSTQRLIHKEKEVDAAHRAFAASLRSSSPVDSPDHHQRHTPRSSISSTKTYRRDLREGSHDSTVPSETSRISSSTVTRQSPNKNVGKTVVAKQTVVKTRNVNGSNETIDLTPQRSTKSPSPSKTITTTTTRTTTTTKKAPTEVPKSDNQIIKPAENIFPINEPLTITKTHISANDASFPGNAVVEEPCIKKNYYKLGPSDKTANDIDERSPYSPAPSNHKTSTHPKHQSPVRDEHSDNYGEAIRNQPFSSSGIRPKERNQSPSKPIKPNDSSPKTISQPEESDVERRTVLGETTIEKNEDQYAVLDEYEPESHSPKSVYPNDVQRKPTRDYPQSRQQPSSRPQSKEPKDYVEEVEFVSEKRYIPTDTRDHPKRVEPTAKPTNKSPSMKTTTTNIAKTTTHTTGKNKIRVTDDEIEVHEPVGKKPSAQKPIGKPSFSQQPQVPVGRIPDTQKPYQPSHVDSDNDDDRANRGPGPYEYEETSTRKDKIRVTDDKTKVLEPIGKRTVSEKPVGRQKSPDVDNGDGDNYPERKSSRHKYDEIITREENRVFDDEIEVLQAIGKRPGSQKPSSQSPQQPFGKKPGSQKTAKPVHESDDDDAGNHPDRKPRTHVFGETQKVDELFKNTHHVKQSKNVNEEFIAIERDNVHHKTDESPDGAFLSRSREPTPTSPTYKKKGVTQRETFEERCRQILGMEDDGDTQGTFKKRPLSELENLDEPIDAERITKTSNNEAQNTIIEVKIEDCEDDEPLYLSNIKQHIQPKGKDTKAPKTTTTSTTFVDKSDISDTDAIVNVECKRSEKYVPYKPSSPDSKRKPVTELDQVVLTSTTTKRGDKTTVKGFNKPHGKSPDDRPESEKKKPSTLEREQSPTGTRKTKKINEKETIYIEAHRSPSPEKTKPKIGGREVVCTEPRRSPSPVMRKPKTSEKDIITETRRSPSPTKSEPKITEKETIYIETRRSPSPVLNKTKTTEKEIISTTNRRSVSPTKIQPKITGKPTSSEVRHMPSSVSNKTKILEKEIVSIENRRSPSPTLPAFKKPTDDTHSEIVTEQEVYVSKKGIKCTEDSTIEKQRTSPSPVSKRTSPEKSPRQPSDSKSSPMRTSPTKSPIRKQPEAANFTTQKMAVTTTKQVSSFEPLDQPKFRTTEKTAIRNKSPNRVPTKTATKVDYVTNDTLEKRTTSATSTKSVNKIEKHTIINKEDIKQKTKPHTTPAPKTTLPKTVRKDKESFAKTTDHSTVVRPSRKPSSESPTPTTKDKLKPSTRKPKHTSASDTNSSPESSPTRSIERRRSSNISVHTEIIIDHTGPKSPKPENKIPKVQKPHSKQPTTKESVDHPMSEKPYRKFPVTERKESAPVHSVTRKEKDAKMTRSTSEKIMKVTGKTISKPEMSSLSPTASPKVDRRPNKCFTTKTINLTTTDKILNSEDMENVIIDIQHAKSSREPSPDKIVPTPVPIDLDTGKPRYPDVVQEPEDEPRKKPIIKNIPIFEEESNAFVSCHISEINIDKSMRSMDINEEDILDNPTIEAPKSLDYPSIDKPDEDCLLSVHEKVSKFTHTAEEVKKPKASSPFNRDFDSTPNVPENDDCLLTVDEKVNKFIRTAENVTKPLSTPFRGTERPNFTEIDEELREDDCTLTVSEKVNKFINTAEKLAPTAPQKSPELVAKIERSISKQSEPEYPDDLSDAEPLTPFSQHHTTELEKKRQKDILSRPSVFETNKTVEYYTELNKDEVLDKRQSHTTLIDIQNIEDDDLTPMTKQHTTNIELRRQKDILSRPSVFEPKKPSDKVRHTRPESPMAKKPKSPSPTRKFIEAEKGEVVECEQYIDITTNKPRSTQLRKSQSPILSKKFINSEKSKAYESERQTKVTADKTKSQKVVERRSQSPKERKPQSPVPKKSIDSATIERFESDQETEITTSKTKTHSPKPITDDKPRSLEPKPLKTSSPYAPKPHEPKGYTKTVTSKVSTTRSRFESPTHDKTPTRKPLHHEPQRNVSYPTVHKRKPSTEQRKPVDKDVRDSDYPTTESDTEITASTTHHKKVEKMSTRKVETSGKLPMQGKPKKPEDTSHSPIRNGSPSTKTTITKVTQRTYKHTSPSETSDTEITETILERPSQTKASPVNVGKKNVIMDTVAARRNLFEKNLISKTQRPTTPVQSGRRPSYMDHTKSSLEHTRRDSLEVNKNNYSRKSSVEDDVNYERRPNAAVKFDVPQRPNRGPSVSEDMDIESIFDLEVLERLLETVTSYEIRRRIRAQIRLVKNNMLNTRETVDRKKSETKTSTIISSAHKSSTYSSKVHHEATDSFSDDMRTEKPRDRSYSPKRPTNVRREEIPDRRPHDRNLSPERGSKPHQEETVTVTEKKYSKLVGDRSQSPKRPLKAPVDDETFGEPKYTKVPYDRSHSPETKIISSSTKEVRRTSGTQSPTQKQYIRTEEVDYSEEITQSPRSERKTYSPRLDSSPTARHRGRSPEVQATPVSSSRGKSPDAKTKKPIREQPRNTSPQSKISKQRDDLYSTTRVTTVKNTQSPERRTSKPKTDEKTPIWADRKNVLKSPSSTTRKPTSSPTTRTSAVKTSTMKSISQRQSKNTEEDSITSSYGIGPTDENGLPLFGIRALKKKKQSPPCETNEEVTGYVIEEKYYSDNKSKPTVERKEYIYSTNADELEDIKKQVESRKQSHGDNESESGVIRRFKKIDKDYIHKEPEAITPESEEFSTSSTKYVRRGSVKEMSEKFIRKESSQSVTEKSSNYPKAGLILLTKGGTTADAGDCFESTSEKYMKTSSSSAGYRSAQQDTDEDYETGMKRSTRMVTESDSECDVKNVQRDVSKKSTTMSTRSFLNSTGESKVVTGVDDVLERMRNADYVVEEGDTAEDQEARSLLNKFLGASVIMKGVESVLPTKQTITTTTTTSYADDSDGDNLSNQAVKTTRITKTIKSGSSSSPVTRTTCDIEEIWDEEILKELLEQATTYEERRKIRARLRELMAEREEKKDLKAGEKSVSDVEEDESSSSEYEEIIEEVTDYSDAEAELEEDLKEVGTSEADKAKASAVSKESGSKQDEAATAEVAQSSSDKSTKTSPAESSADSVCDEAKSASAERGDAAQKETAADKASVDKTDTSDKGESLMPLLQDLLHKNLPQARVAANQNSNPPSKQAKQATKTLSTSTNKACTAGPIAANCSSESSNSCTVRDNYTNSHSHTKTNTHQPTKTKTNNNTTNNNNNNNNSNNTKQSQKPPQKTMTKDGVTTAKATSVSGSDSSARRVDRLSVPQKEDSGTESGEDLRLIAAGLRDKLQLQSDTNLIQEVTAALSRLESSLKEGKEIPVDGSKREALLALVARLQTGLTSPDKLAEAPMAGCEVDGGGVNYDETSSPEADAHRSNRARFARRRNRNSRHTVGVSREELADARRYMEDMILMENISSCTTPDASTNPVTPPQLFPIEKNASSGAILTHAQSTLYRPNQFVPSSIKQSTECLDSEQHTSQTKEVSNNIRPFSGNYSVNFEQQYTNASNNAPANQLKQMLTEVERDSRNTSPDSITKSNRFSAKKQLMKRANTIDIPKSKKYNPDFDSDSENEGRGPIFGLKRTVQVSVKHKARNVIPPFEPKTENDHKFLAFINKQSAKPGLGWANSRSVSNWTNKFGNLKHTFEVGVAASTTTGKPPQVPGHVPHNAAKNYWNKQVSQYPDLGQPQSSNAQQQTQRNQFEAAERQRKLERERFERERIERDRLERQRQERERLERDRLEREFYEREQMERERLAAAQHAAMPSMSVPKPAPVNQFIHAPQSVFRPIDNSDSHTHNIFKPIPQLPSKVNIWQPPSSLNIPLSAPAQMSAQSPQFFMPKQPKNTSHVTSPSSTTSSPVGLPWVSKPAVDNSDFRKKANTFEERSQNDNRANSYLQRHNSLRSPRANQQLVEEYRKRPSLPNAADPFLAPQSQYAPQQAYAPAIDTYPPPPINMSFKYSDYNRKGNFKSQPCLPSAVESEYTRKREDSLTDPHLMPLVLTTSNPSYGTEPDSLQPYVNAPPKQFDYISPMDSAPTSPSIMTLAQTDYTDDDLDSEMLEYRVESKVMGKPQSQTAVTVGSRTAHVSDDEVFGKNSRAARNLLHTMKNLGGSNNGLQQKREAPKKPSAPTSPNVCLSPDGRAYQAPVVEPLFPQLTNFEPNRSPQYINQNSTQPPAPKYSKPRTYTPPMPKHTDRSFQLSKYDKPHREQMPYTKSNTAPYISETQPAYVVTYPLEDQQENIYQKQHPISLPLQRNRNISENSTTSSTLSISQNLPSPGTNWTANPVHVDDYQVAPPRKHSANREDHSLSHSGHHYEYPQTQPRPFAANTVQPDVQPMPVNFPASQKPDVAPKPHGPPHNVKTQQYTPPPPQIHQEPPPPQQQPQQTQLQQTASAAHYQLSPASVQKPIGTERSTQPKRSPAISVSRQSQSLDIKQYESQSQKSSFIRQGAMDAGMGSLQTQNRVLSQQSLVSKKQQQFQQQKEQQLTELRRKSLGNALEMQQQQRKTAYLSETQNLIKQEYKSSAPADTPDIVKSSLPKEDGPILKKFGPPQRHHYVPNSYQSPGSNTQSKKFESSSKVTRSEQHEIVQHSTMTTKPSIVEIPVTPQPAEDLIPRNIVFNNVSAFSSMSRRRDDDERAPEQQPRQPNRLSKSDSWNQIVQMQSQANAQLPPVSPKFGSSGNELRRTKSGHSLNVRMYEAGIDKAVVNEKQRTVEAYFTGKKSPNQLTNEVESRMMASSKKSAINRTKTSEKVSTSQQQQSTATTEKTETKEEDGAVVTTTTKVTTRTITGTGTAPKPVSPFAKFKQLDKQNSLQSQKSPSTPTTPGGSAASPSGSARIFHFTDPALNARAATVKDQLLQWCQFKTQEYENVQITNFSTSWSDGLAFCALIHHFLPDAFDYSKLTPQSRRHNFELAFTVADEKAGIAPLLDVEDMVEMKRPDWKCVFVYVQSIYRRFRNCQ